MLDLIEQHRQALVELCRHHGVARLDLFGSAARGEFRAADSDLDFLVVFRRDDSPSAPDRYLGLLSGLEALFGRKIDLVDVRVHCNPYFMADALRHREVMYVA